MIVYGFGLRVSGSGFRFGLVLACLAHDFWLVLICTADTISGSLRSQGPVGTDSSQSASKAKVPQAMPSILDLTPTQHLRRSFA